MKISSASGEKSKNLLRLRFRKTFMNSVEEKSKSYDKKKFSSVVKVL